MGVYDSTIGTLLIGIFINTFLYGLVTYQYASYCRTKFNDRLIIKCMVHFLFILDTFHSASVVYMAWIYTVSDFGDAAAIGMGVWPYQFTPLATAITALVTQMYLTFRIWRLTRNIILCGAVILLAIPSFILGITCSIEAWIITIMSELPRITPIVIAWLSLQVIVDTLITITLIVVFSRSRTGFRKTDTIINQLIRGAIQTGFFAGMFSMGDLFTFVFLPTTNLYGMFAIPIGRIYTNTLLDSLLTRELLKGGSDLYNMSAAIRSGPATSSQGNSTHQAANIQVSVQRTIHEVCEHSSYEDADSKVVELAV